MGVSVSECVEVKMEERKWYCVEENGSAVGPFTAPALREQCRRQGRDANEVLVWREGWRNWVALTNVKELHQEHGGTTHVETFSVRTMTFDPDADSTGAPGRMPTLASGSTSGRTLEQRKRGRDNQQTGTGGGRKGRTKSRAGATAQQREHTTTSVYVTGLPDDADEMEVRDVFSKCGIIKSAGDTDAGGSDGYKIKLYRDMASGMLKGDALVTYLKVRYEHASQQLLLYFLRLLSVCAE